MAITPGLYKAAFSTPLGHGNGVVVVADGHVKGGDAAMAYLGTYVETAEAITATLRIFRHTSDSQIQNVFGRENVTAKFAGRPNGDGVELQGESPDAPGVRMHATLTPLER